jgi:hypothetical protein
MRDPRCSYVVILESARLEGEVLQELAGYLSELVVAGCDVVVLDPGSRPEFEERMRVLRWVGRHLAMPPGVDAFHAAAAFATCEKVILAAPDVRYSFDSLAQIRDLLDIHEVVQPQIYLDPLPWWGGVEAARMLVHRAVDVQADHGGTFGFRRAATRRVAARTQGHFAKNVLVRRHAGAFPHWLAQRPRAAGEDFALPVKTAFFLALVPLMILFTALGGARIAGTYAGIIAFSSLGLAIRGRSGVGSAVPLRAILFAPVWVLERSLSVYWALFQKLRGADSPAHPEDVPATGYTSTNVRHG